MLTPGRRNEFIECQKAKVRITVLTIMDVKTHWNSTLDLLDISNNPIFRLKRPGVPDGSDRSDRTSYLLTEKYELHVAQGTGPVADLPILLCGRNDGSCCILTSFTLRQECGDVYAPSQ